MSQANPSDGLGTWARTAFHRSTRALLVSFVAALAFTVLDALFARRNHLDFPARAVLHLLRAHGVAALVIGVALELVQALARGVGRKVPWLAARPVRASAVCGALLAAPVAWLLVHSLARGDWIAAQPWVRWFRLGATAALILGGAVVGWGVSQRTRGLVQGLGLSLALLFQLADRLVLVGLYPQLHVALYLGALLLTWLGLTEIGRELAAELATATEKTPGSRRLGQRFLPALGLLVVLGYASAALGPLARQIASLRLSSSLRTVVSAFTPPADRNLVLRVIRSQREEPLAPVAETRELRHEPLRNVLLIVVDTLRADALAPGRDRSSPFQGEDTPFLDRWLESAYRFDTAYSAANVTRLSMPATFESRQPFETEKTEALSLGERAHRAGLSTHALVTNWFLGINGKRMQVLDGFDDVRTYDRPTRKQFVRSARQLLRRAKDKPFFAWLHYMGMHAPYDGHEAHDPLSTPVEQYRAALRELDSELAHIEAELRRLKLDRDTLVVLTADHGELLGEQGRQFHGQSLLDAEIRVPLAFWVPGGKPRVVSGLVGNIDIVPTIFDLLGQSTDDAQGRSLVSRLAGAKADAGTSYYVLGNSGNASGLVTPRQVLLHERDTGNLSVFDRADLLQQRDLLGQDPLDDIALLDAFVETNPRLFERDLVKPETSAALIEQLDRLELRGDSRALEVLTRFASISREQAVREATMRAFRRTNSAAVRRRLIVEMRSTDPLTWSGLAQSELERGQAGEEVEWLKVLTHARMPLTNEYWAVQRLEATSDCRSPLAHAWLAYLSVSSLSELSLPVLGKQLGCAGKDLRELSLVLGALSRVRVNGPQPEIEARLIEVSTTKRQRPHIVALAVGALGAVGGSAADEHLRKIAASTGDGRIANAAVLAIARIEKTAATPFLLEYAKKHPDQRSGVVSALIEEGDDRALPTLAEWLATASGTTAAHLKEAIVAVKKRPADLQRELAEEEIEPH